MSHFFYWSDLDLNTNSQNNIIFFLIYCWRKNPAISMPKKNFTTGGFWSQETVRSKSEIIIHLCFIEIWSHSHFRHTWSHLVKKKRSSRYFPILTKPSSKNYQHLSFLKWSFFTSSDIADESIWQSDFGQECLGL